MMDTILTSNGHYNNFESKLHANKHMNIVKFLPQCVQLEVIELLLLCISKKKTKQKFR